MCRLSHNLLVVIACASVAGRSASHREARQKNETKKILCCYQCSCCRTLVIIMRRYEIKQCRLNLNVRHQTGDIAGARLIFEIELIYVFFGRTNGAGTLRERPVDRVEICFSRSSF
uniref:Putative secreted protein n=1 Tax=Amblyomma triste TaxID=251400 RepID=A0A023G4A9_AMBTT